MQLVATEHRWRASRRELLSLSVNYGILICNAGVRAQELGRLSKELEGGRVGLPDSIAR